MTALILCGAVVCTFLFLIPVLKLKPNFPDSFAKDVALWIFWKEKHLLTSHAITDLSRRLFSMMLVNRTLILILILNILKCY